MSTSDFNWAKGTSMPVNAIITPACYCVGPQNGQPLCPCKMRSVKIKNGRYVIPEQDLGPAPTTEIEEYDKAMETVAESGIRELNPFFKWLQEKINE